MLSIAFYLLKVIICSAVLFGYYWFFLRNKIFHSYNRVYLLAIVVISLLAPVIKINIWHEADVPQTNVIKVLQVVNSSNDYMDEVILYSQYNYLTKEKLLTLFYVLVSAIFLIMFLNALIKIRKLLKQHSATQIENIFFVKTHAKGTPFSFLKFIFWNEAIDLDTKAGKQIFKHELAHVQEKHSYDKLFINMLLIFCWCNPFFWLIRKELNMIHEFIADKKAVENGNSADFAAMILQATYPQYKFPLANNFFYSPIKRRLMMLTKQNKTRVSYLTRLIVLPIGVIVFAAFTIKTKPYSENINQYENKVLTIVIDPGHGGTDKGARANDGTYENELSLAFAQKIKGLNNNENIKILLTRESDIYMSPKEKSQFAKDAGADLFISIHMAAKEVSEKSAASGMEIFVSRDQFKNSVSSKLFASAVIGSFQGNYGLQVPSNPMQRQVGIWVLQKSDCPAVLIEAGYLTNEKDLKYLKTESAAETFAKNILAALNKYQSQESSEKEQALNEISISGNSIDTIPAKKITEKQLTLQLEEEKMILKNKQVQEQIRKSETTSDLKKVKQENNRKKIESLKENKNQNELQEIKLHELTQLLNEKQLLVKQNIEVLKLAELGQTKSIQKEKELLMLQQVENLKQLEMLKKKMAVPEDTLLLKPILKDK